MHQLSPPESIQPGQSTRARALCRHILSDCFIGTVGVLLVSTYPGVGSTIAWLCGWDGQPSRRAFQLTTLVFGVACLLTYLRRCGVGRRRSLPRSLLLAAVLGTMVIAIGSSAGLFVGERNCSLTLWSTTWLAWGALWGAAIMIWCVAALTPSRPPATELQPKSAHRTHLQTIVTVIGALLALTVWFRGPENSDGAIHLSCGGNQNVLVTAFLTLGGFVLWRRGLIGLLSAIPWIYLSILTTSRLAVIAIPVIALAVPTDPLHLYSGCRRLVIRRFIAGFTLVMVAAFFSIAPVAFLGVPLPYKGSGDITHAKEWMARQGRNGRMLDALSPVPSRHTGAPNESVGVDGSVGLEEPVGMLAYSASIPDDRLQLWTAALKEAGERPFGAWACPPSFQTQVRLPDGSVMGYAYTSPHNMTLEFMLAFGWVAGLLALIGSLALAWMSLRSLATCDSIVVVAAAIGCLVELIRVQFSGNLWDGLGLLINGLVVAIWYATRSLSTDAQVATSVGPRSIAGAEGL